MGKRRNTKRPKSRPAVSKKRKSKVKKKKVIPKKKRDIVKTPGLNKNLFSKVKQEYHDIDYAGELTHKEQVWLSQFMEEYLGAQLDEKRLMYKYARKAMHKTKRQRKDCFDRNNARQRDIQGLGRAMGTLNGMDRFVLDILDEAAEDPNFEELRIELIEAEKVFDSILSLEEYETLKDRLTPDVNEFYIKHYKIKSDPSL